MSEIVKIIKKIFIYGLRRVSQEVLESLDCLAAKVKEASVVTRETKETL